MKKTQNYNLNLPEPTDVISIDDLNSNIEFIDKELYKKADRSYVDTQVEQAGKVKSVNGMIGDVELHGDNIKHNSYRTINEELGLKANTWDLLDKADKNHKHSAGDILESKTRKFVSENQLSDISKIPHKADKSYVDDKLDEKADKSYVDDQMLSAGKVNSVNGKAGSVVLDARDIKMNGWTTVTVADKVSTLENLINVKASDLDTKINEKVDKKYVDDELSGKASVYHSHSASSIVQTDNRNFVTSEEKEAIESIGGKADKRHTHLASDILESKTRNFVSENQLSDISRIPYKADQSYVDIKLQEIDVDQFEATDKGSQSFDTLKESGVFRVWDSSTSPCGTNADYIVAVYKHNNNIIQVAHSSTNTSSTSNKVYVRSYYNSTWTSWRELTNTELEDEVKTKAHRTHSHSAMDISESYSRKFVSSSQLSDINTIPNKADKSELDEVKRSGVESNRILVDALNSKKVSASTNDSIRTNVNKVKDIHVGDYSIGDHIPYSKLDILLTSTGGPARIFKKDITKPTAVAMTDNYIYVGTDSGRLYKLRLDGTTVWNKLVGSSAVSAVDTDGDRYIYIGLDNGEFKKITSGGGVMWTRTTGDGRRVYSLTFKNGYIYTKTNTELRKTSEYSSNEWTTSEYRDSSQIAVDDDGYIYIKGDNHGTSHPRYIYKISPAGKTVASEYIYTDLVGGVCISNGRVFTSETSSFLQLDNNLKEKIKQPVANEVLTNEICKLKPDEDGNYIYGMSGNYAVKVSQWGGIVWRSWQGNDLRDIDYNDNYVVAVQDNSVELFSSMDIRGVYLK